MDSDTVKEFGKSGIVGPFSIFTTKETCSLLDELINNEPTLKPAWPKGNAATNPIFYKVALHPRIMEVVSAILGKNVMLWGAQLIARPAKAVHDWHTDIETADNSKSVSVWLGLENCNKSTGLKFAAGSHLHSQSIQKRRHKHKLLREAVTDEIILSWLSKKSHKGKRYTYGIEHVDCRDGYAVFFDGRVWHGVFGTSPKPRYSLLLQYSIPSIPIRIPDFEYLDWPFRFQTQYPPCIMIRGDGHTDANKFVSPPTHNNSVRSGIYPLSFPLPLEDVSNPKGTKTRKTNKTNKNQKKQKVLWKAFDQFSGSLANIGDLGCHVSTLVPGHSPHPPHQHEEEELLIMMKGEADLILPSVSEDAIHLKKYQCVFYPAGFSHTLKASGNKPAHYLMLKWKGPKWNLDGFHSSSLLSYTFRDIKSPGPATGRGYHIQNNFEGSTKYLTKLECHSSTLTPGAGYAAHYDAHDVVIILFKGKVRTLSQKVKAPAIIFYASGEPHGILNVGKTLAQYLVFEFHG